VPCLPAFQPPEKRVCVGRVVSGSLQRSDHLTLMSDVSFSAVEKAVGFLKELFQGNAVHVGSLAAGINARPLFCPWSRPRHNQNTGAA
jgi:hypothetical protein